MKLRKTIQAKPTPASKNLRLEADRLGALYETETALKSKHEKNAKAANALIKEFADSDGEPDGKRVVIKGDRYVVGYSETDPKPFLDTDSALKLLPKKVLAKVTRTVQVIDEALLEEAVKEGKVSPAELMQVMKTPTPSKVIYVQTRRDYDKARAEANK